MHEIAGILAKKQDVDWTRLALQAGYFDQAHFINDFRSLIGQTPTEYLNSLTDNRNGETASDHYTGKRVAERFK